MAQYMFGSGVLWATPLTDYAGTAISNPTPVQLAVLQEVGVDMSFDTKALHGQNQFPVAIARGKGKLDFKTKAAQINGAALNSLVFGQTMTSGIFDYLYDVTGEVIGTTPYQITVDPPGTGTWAADMGVRNSSGLPMTRVASSPATGEYSVSAGVYTFAAADTGKTVFISYQYTDTSTSAKKSTVKNVLMGYMPTFRGDLYVPYGGKSLALSIPKCVISKWSFTTKQDDFAVPEWDFSAFADDAGNVMTWAVYE